METDLESTQEPPETGEASDTPSVNDLPEVGEQPESLETKAHAVFGDAALFGPGLQQEWTRIGGADRPEEFAKAYVAYVSDPEALQREAREQYEFLREHIFYGREYTELSLRDEQIREAVEALETLDELRPEVWEGLSVGERTQALQETENRLAEAAGRTPVDVVVEEMEPGLNGYFDGETLHLNSDFVADAANLSEAVDTVAHEGRHAYQHYATQHPGFHPDAAEVEAWADNFVNYLTPDLFGYEAYRNQPVEADAWAFGDGVRDGLYGKGASS